ncbi:NAD(P)-dependent oxidoreductase, partial [Bacillus safensis]|uniref:NAD(P)-dependent oxidoreductase n=2 Tax=Bacillaceae TaxID=186817 RepID=UPI002FFEC120
MEIKKIGWFGLGTFGYPIAENLIDNGYEVHAYTFRGHGVKGVERLVKNNSAFIGKDNDISDMDALVLSLPTTSDVEDVLSFYDSRLPKVVIDLTTGDPNKSKEISDSLRFMDILYFDAPVSGSIETARSGNLTVFAGISKENVDQSINSLLNKIGTVFYFDKQGNGNIAKLINQLIHLSNIGIIGEALKVASACELDQEELVHCLKTSSANSKMLERFGESIIHNNFEPYFKLKLANKDINLVDQL